MRMFGFVIVHVLVGRDVRPPGSTLGLVVGSSEEGSRPRGSLVERSGLYMLQEEASSGRMMAAGPISPFNQRCRRHLGSGEGRSMG